MNWDTASKRAVHIAVVVAFVVGFTLAGFGVTSAATTTTVSVTPSDDTANVGETVTFDVRVDNVDNGVGSYEFNFSVNDSQTAEITDVSLQGTSPSDMLTSVEYADDNSSVFVAAGVAGHDNGVIASITVQTKTAGDAGLSLSKVSIGDDDASTYSISSTNGATLDVVEQAVSVTVDPNNTTVSTNKTTEIDLEVTNASAGVGSYAFEVSIPDPSTATLDDVSLVGTNETDALTEVTWGENGANLSVSAAAADADDGRIATLSVRGQSNGTTQLSVESAAVGDDVGNSYTVGSLGSAAINVLEGTIGPGPVNPNFKAPNDVDGDGKFEDVNGDGEFTIVDVSALLKNQDSKTIQESPEYFDYNDDGKFDIVDVSKLLIQVS